MWGGFLRYEIYLQQACVPCGIERLVPGAGSLPATGPTALMSHSELGIRLGGAGVFHLTLDGISLL